MLDATPTIGLDVDDGGTEPLVVGGGTGVAHGAGGCLHEVYSWPGARSGGTHSLSLFNVPRACGFHPCGSSRMAELAGTSQC